MRTYKNPEPSTWSSLCSRPALDYQPLMSLVSEVFEQVSARGDSALIEYTQKFDRVELSDVAVSSQEVQEGIAQVSDELKQAICLAKDQIEAFHRAQITQRVSVERTPGVLCWQEKKPIQKVGLYIPGGSAPLFSTILMLAVPAQIAGCQEVVMCTPAQSNGSVHPAVLYTAQLCGVTKIFKLGGIQAIAAMTLGTASVPAVYKIFGPGNQYVTAAKQYAQQFGVSIDMPAGPSELLVLCDHTAQPSFVAADLLSQAEHGPDSQVVLVSLDPDMLSLVNAELQAQVVELPRREIALKALENSLMVHFSSTADAADWINLYAPEHYIIAMDQPDFFVNSVQNAGSVFIGHYTPESAGDYASGTNHTLPTNGYAKQYSGVHLDSFQKQITFQEIKPQGLQVIGPAVALMAEAEGLEAHKQAVTKRLMTLD